MNLEIFKQPDDIEEQNEMDDYFEGDDLEIILVALQELETVIKEDNLDSQETNNEFLLKIQSIQEKIMKTIPKNLIN
tara:strand:+ start:1402 stop:1632 length:231 start_codon:yes stop_codon:yes gene_type:complete